MGKDNVQIKGSLRPARCELQAYKFGCPDGRTPHHVVPDHCFKQPGKNGGYYAGAVEHAEGLCVCVDGPTKHAAISGGTIKRKGLKLSEFYKRVADHGKIHALFDTQEQAIGKKGTPVGTSTLGEMENRGARVVAAVTGCDRQDLKDQLRDYHSKRGLSEDYKVRADPLGKIKNLDPKAMGSVNQATTGAGAGL